MVERGPRWRAADGVRAPLQGARDHAQDPQGLALAHVADVALQRVELRKVAIRSGTENVGPRRRRICRLNSATSRVDAPASGAAVAATLSACPT
jgi:hypothetical protein